MSKEPIQFNHVEKYGRNAGPLDSWLYGRQLFNRLGCCEK